MEALLQVGEQQRQLWLDKILATVQKQPLDTAIIGRDLIRDVLQVSTYNTQPASAGHCVTSGYKYPSLGTAWSMRTLWYFPSPSPGHDGESWKGSCTMDQ